MSVAIIGAGASGCLCAYFLLKNNIEVTLFDYGTPLRTILPTGGGRCNLAHAEYDIKELVQNYPRGEKFLYSVFSKFSTQDTLSTFEEIGIQTYTQNDGRIFPLSNSSKDVRKKLLSKIKNAQIKLEKIINIEQLENGFKLKSENAEYYFDNTIIATGGFCKSKPIEGIRNTVTPTCPSLVGLNSDIKNLSGIVLNNIYSKDCKIYGDLLFTHFGISGPLVYQISSIKAFENFPYSLSFDLSPTLENLQDILNNNPQKELKNILSKKFPHRFCDYLLGELKEKKACNINGKTRDLILEKIHDFNITVVGTNKGEETVTAGGYKLDEINPKTLESKLHPNLYIIGEALNIDGLCGGYNLQNAWSTAFVAANSILIKSPNH